MDLEIAINCHNYQHRLCWMLSSILQQDGNIPNILVNISYTPNNGSPTTENVCAFFRDAGLDIKETVLDMDQIKNRSYARQVQSEEKT